MKAIISKTGIYFVLFAIAVLIGCETSINTVNTEPENQEVNGSLVAAATTVVNDGLQPVNISGITASNFVTAGVGTHSGDPEQIEVTVPSGATVEAVFLYWSRRGSKLFDDSTPAPITVNGNPYTGNVIGGPVDMPAFDQKTAVAYRVNLTGEGIVTGSGTTIITVQDGGLSGTTESLGASVLVFYSWSGPQSELILYDGVDFLYAPYKTISGADHDKELAWGTAEPITFTFTPASQPRTATLHLFIGDVGDNEPNRPNSLIIQIGSNTQEFGSLAGDDPIFQAFEGPQWDNFDKKITIPANVNEITVEPVSGPGSNPSSLIWSLAGLSIQPPQGGQGCTPGYWRQPHHYDSWTTYSPSDIFDNIFDVPSDLKLRRPEKGYVKDVKLKKAIKLRGGKINALIRHTVAALLNAASSGVSYDLTVDQVIEKFNDAVADGGKKAIEKAKNDFADFNEQGCPLN